MPSERQLVDRFRLAWKDAARVVLPGFHPLKHALRFGAHILEAASPEPERVLELAAGLAPDLADQLATLLAPVPAHVFALLSPHPPASPVIALARRPAVDVAPLLASGDPAPVVLLDRPAHLGNVGAVIRVAAAAGAAGVLTTGEHDPWHPAAVRGAAGLHFALPVARVAELPETDRLLIAVAPGGEPIGPGVVPPRAILAFGSERRGLGDTLRRRADRVVGIPMRPGVSSLNLATSVAVALYLAGGPAGGREGTD